ncbi:hypothetical protein XELAEV_18013145mg [Xenopus laevis]|uniref:Uncharacterized protein n=1 Tax=Xenopus laevis TaxID=8355 RepID=A0A974DNV1_XENLA|nr:hypothetical protein XELAEV_18013145mg [Xenopus laevis]
MIFSFPCPLSLKSYSFILLVPVSISSTFLMLPLNSQTAYWAQGKVKHLNDHPIHTEIQTRPWPLKYAEFTFPT